MCNYFELRERIDELFDYNEIDSYRALIEAEQEAWNMVARWYDELPTVRKSYVKALNEYICELSRMRCEELEA